MRVTFGLKLLFAMIVVVLSPLANAQTAGTGAISGTVTDPSGAVVTAAKVSVTNQATGGTVTVLSTNAGRYLVPLLSPGDYRVDVTKESFKVSTYPNIVVAVTETRTLNLALQVGTVSESVQVDSSTEQLQTESSALGHVTNEEMVENLPLVTRNYTQIIGLSPGVATDVTNAEGEFRAIVVPGQSRYGVGSMGPGFRAAGRGRQPTLPEGYQAFDSADLETGREIETIAGRTVTLEFRLLKVN